jgi:hypothetical protein
MRLLAAALLSLAPAAASSLPAQAAGGAAAVDTAEARRLFAEARALSARDAGRLWGVRLAGPMLLADPATRAVAADRADAEGRLARRGEVWVGTLPPETPLGNAAVAWAGRRWTMLIRPLPPDSLELRMLAAHELWHRVQEEIGLPAASPANAHLDERDARLWLRLEGRALRAALLAEGAARRAHAADAIAFRRRRAALFSGSDSTEAALELNEGLANYTGVRLAGWDAAGQRVRAARLLETMDTASALGRSFAYATGPAYGLLLDELGDTAWRREVRPPAALPRRLERQLDARAAAAGDERATLRRAEPYGHAELLAAERERATRRAARLAELRARFVDGPVLRLPMAKMQMSFDPTAQETLDTLGVVYPTLRISAAWGILTVASGGALLGWNVGQVVLPAPRDATPRPLGGDGWTLELKEGWEVVPGERAGDLVVRRVR